MPGSPAEFADAYGVIAAPAGVYVWFADLALRTMANIVEELGDDLANTVPELSGANSPFAILTHCLGLTEYWAGATVAGRQIQRDRASEFTASGDVAELLARTEAARRRLRDDIVGVDSFAVPSHVVRDPDDPVPYTETKGAALLHILEELFQHLGHMEITRDMLEAGK